MTAATANQSSTLPDAVQSLPEKQQRIYKYLAEKVSTKTYFKSRLIGEELSLSSK
jgi:hypothetical protein